MFIHPFYLLLSALAHWVNREQATIILPESHYRNAEWQGPTSGRSVEVSLIKEWIDASI